MCGVRKENWTAYMHRNARRIQDFATLLLSGLDSLLYRERETVSIVSPIGLTLWIRMT